MLLKNIITLPVLAKQPAGPFVQYFKGSKKAQFGRKGPFILYL